MQAYELNAEGVIINAVIVDSLHDLPNLYDASIGGQIGDSIINGILIPRPPPVLDAEQLRNEVKAKISEIEQEHPITPRNLRELGLAVAELIHAVTGSYPTGPAYQQAKDLDAVIADLRTQL